MPGAGALRALVLLSTVLEVPALGAAARRMTRMPRDGAVQIAGSAVEALAPAGPGPWPTFVFLNGAHPERRREPVVRRVTEGLARAGFLVLLPDPPGVAEGQITPATLDAVLAVTRGAVALPEVRDGRVALLGASTGGSLALLAAADPQVRDRISVVVAVTPFADLEKMVCLATTRTYEGAAGRAVHAVSDLLRRSVAHSLAAAIDEAADGRRVLGALAGASGLDDPGALRACLADLALEGRAVVRLILNEDPDRFAELFAALPPEVRSAVRRLSPVMAAAQVGAPVELVVPPRDEYFPHDEVMSLARALPHVRLTVTPSLDHTRPSASLMRLGSVVGFARSVVRGLAQAASPGDVVRSAP
jgi:pimeloyl-ACP methyl ester carboxylesterase